MFVKDFATTNLSEEEKLTLKGFEKLNGAALNGSNSHGTTSNGRSPGETALNGRSPNGTVLNGTNHLPKLVLPNGETFEIPVEVFHAFQEMTSHLIQGKAFSVIPLDCLFDIDDAKEYFCAASRANIVEILEKGELPFIEGEFGRLMRFGDILQYEERMRQRQLEFIEWMSQISQEAGEY